MQGVLRGTPCILFNFLIQDAQYVCIFARIVRSGRSMTSAWDDLYERPSQLEPEWAHERIFAQIAYAPVLARQSVPIVHLEALAMAAWFPVCWLKHGDSFQLSVLRSLLPDGSGQPVGSPRTIASLPLLLRSYPVVVCDDLGKEGRLWIDKVIADNPTDGGAPMVKSDGRPSRGLMLRYRSALVARQAFPVTEQISAGLALLEAFEPWPLAFPLGHGVEAEIQNAYVVRPDLLETPRVRALLRVFGIEAGILLTAHRLSLFRIGQLIRSAKAAVTQRAASAHGPAAADAYAGERGP
jgi:hypothetical protein